MLLMNRVVGERMKEYLTSTNVTLDNICDVCIFNEDECNEYRECCYKEYIDEMAGERNEVY